MAIPSFLFGGSTNETPSSIKQKRDLVRALMGASNAPRNIGEGLNALGDGIVANVLDRRATEAESKGTSAANELFNSIIGTAPSASSMPSTTGAGEQMAATSPAGAKPLDMSGNEVFGQFIDTVKQGGVQNPYALSAIAATGKAESGFDPKNATRTWSDPSESGQPGTAGGIMSWRGPRYQALAATGDLSPAGQAKFFLQENPQLIQSLNNAKSVEEAQTMMNNAWKFAGYNRPGGEASRRMQLASSFLPTFQNREVAASTPQAAIEAAAPASGYVDPMVSAPNARPSMTMAGGRAQGMISPGNIDLANRPVVKNQDGSISTVRSMSFEENGREILVPTVSPDGRILSDQEAIDQYHKSGQNLGVFANPNDATAYAQTLHNQQAGMYGGNTSVPPLDPPRTIAPPPQVAQVAPPQQRQTQSPQNGAFGGVDPRILQALQNPFINEGQRQALQMVAKQQMEANDPLRQMQMQEQEMKLKAMQNPGPEYDFIPGKDGSIFRTEKRSGTIDPVYGGKPDRYRTLTDAEEQQFGLDPSKAYQIGADDKIQQIGGGGTTVNIDQKAEGAFDKKLAEKQAETFDSMATEGMNARADLGVINELDGLLQGQGGTLSGLAGIAAKYGIGGKDMGDLQAANALINKLIPSQRQPGSGSMSDRDVEMFTRSLPSLWNQPGGNAKIINVMRGLTQYKQQQGEIADQVLTGDMTRQEARRALRALPNPLEEFRNLGQQKKPVVIDGYTVEEAE